MGKWSEKIPSFAWILMIVAAIAALIGALWGGFYAVTHLEGVGSIFLLICAWAALRAGANSPDLGNSPLGIALVIVFFAMIGIAFDQPGNYIYNRPLEWIFCPAETELTRDVVRRAARGGGVSISQNFQCVAADGKARRAISMWEQLFFRFFEYVAIGYALLGASRLYTRIFKKPKRRSGLSEVKTEND
ncbi:MAG TPA: hypothetical protein VIL74_21855 [Pyrinomonadaceae bacterium]|jgi:hypothetical protein